MDELIEHFSPAVRVEDLERFLPGTLFKGHVISDSSGCILFRYQRNSFGSDLCHSQIFVFPVPKIAVIRLGEAEWGIGRSVYRVGPGDIVVLRPGTIRCFNSIPRACGLVCDLYEFVPDFLLGQACLNLFMADYAEDCTLFSYRGEESDRLLSEFERIKEELEAARHCCCDVVRGCLSCILSELSRGFSQGFETDRVIPWSVGLDAPGMKKFEYSNDNSMNMFAFKDHSNAIAYAMNVIRWNVSGDISIDRLAEAAHLSRSHFFKVFRKYSGMSVNDYILKCRVDNTVRLLMDTDCSILDAAYSSGFTSNSGFYKSFIKVTGCTPKEYIRNIKEGWLNK